MNARIAALLIVLFLWSVPGFAQGLEIYAGTYQIEPRVKVAITLEGNRLVGRFAGSPPLPLDALSATKFRINGPLVQLEFFKDEKGTVTHVVLSQNGQQFSAARLPERKPVTLPDEILKRYVGKYARRPGLDLVITLEGDRQLMAESTGQFKYPLFAESETRFFFKDVDADIEFAKSASGAVDHLILHRGPVYETARRSSITPSSAAKTGGAAKSVSLPAELSDREFWKIVTDFSEPNGFYRFENFVSNEDDYQAVLPELKRTFNPDSIFIGVGPEQNLSYIAALKPRLAFVVDIRRQNMLELLLYKALFELSADRVEFLSRLFSRKAPAGLTASSSAAAIFDAFEQMASDQQLFDANLALAWDLLTMKHGFELSDADKQGITKVYAAFFKGGPSIDYQTNDIRFTRSRVGPAPASWRYKALMASTTDRNGHNWSYLATEESFRTVQGYQKKNLIVPLVGDFAGPTTLRAIGQYAQQHDATIGVFYTSNVDEYLFENKVQDKFLANVASFPLDPSSMMIRVNGGPSGEVDGTYQVADGKRWAALVSSLPELVKAFKDGEIQMRTDVNWLTRRTLD
jgi:hypothetical protein